MSSPHQGEEPPRPPHAPAPGEHPRAEHSGHYVPHDEAAARMGNVPPGQPAGGQPPHPGVQQRYQYGQQPPQQWGTPSQQPIRRSGPGWLGALGIAVVAALFAGVLGGLGGGLVASSAGVGESGGGGPTIVDDGKDQGADQRADDSIAAIADEAVPSVVTVRVRGASGAGTGSGWVYDGRGHIVTNNHVVQGAGQGGRVSIEMADGTRRDAEVVGTDTSYDVAVLEVDPEGLEPLDIGKSEDVVVGDDVVAVGSPLGLGSTVTSGIVSALERPVSAGEPGAESYISAIQTDAAINPGNSGGPLLNSSGDVIGVNSAIAQVPGQGSGSGSIGVGFAIPSDVVVRIAQQLIKSGEAVHPIIGVSLDRRWSGEGAKVLEQGDAPGGQSPVVPGGPADKAGIEPGDVIVAMDGRRVTDLNQLVVRIRAKSVGDEVSLKVRRDGKLQKLKMKLEAAEDN